MAQRKHIRDQIRESNFKTVTFNNLQNLPIQLHIKQVFIFALTDRLSK